MPRPAPARPAPYHHGDLRQALLQAARRILDRQGAAQLSLREAAKQAKVSPAAPYRHFKNKEALLAALAEEGFEALDQALQAAAKRHPGKALAQLEDLGVAYLRLAAQRPHFFRMMFSVDLGPSRADQGVVRACDRVQMGLVEILKQRLTPGRGQAADLEHQFLLYWSTLHGYAMLMIDHKLDDLKFSLDQHCRKLESLIRSAFDGPKGRD